MLLATERGHFAVVKKINHIGGTKNTSIVSDSASGHNIFGIWTSSSLLPRSMEDDPAIIIGRPRNV